MAQKLTLRTLLAYIDDTLEPAVAAQLGAKVAESELARELIEKIKKVTRRRGLKVPSANADDDGVSDPNTVAEYLSNSLESEQVTRLEETCLESDSHLAEVAACHQILTMILTEPVRVPPKARERMYKLVPPPASSPTQRKKLKPVGSVVPEASEPDDADAAFLLGFGRYSGASVMRRAAAAAAVVAISLLLAVAVIMALPGGQPEPPPTDHRSFAQNTAAVPPPVPLVKEKEKEPEKRPVKPVPMPPKEKEKEPEVAPPPKKVGEDLLDRPAPPRMERGIAGKIEGVNTIVVTRADDGPAWLRLDPADESAVSFADQVLAMPGFKADVQLDTGIKVHLWGNVPELLPSRLLEARVRFHVPERKAGDKGEDFDADISLLTGRIYVGTTKASGGRVRIRFANQVWDVTLADAKSEFVIEAITAFDPGTPFAKEGGALPRVEVQAAVVRGTASLAIPQRFKNFPKLVAPIALAWDSKIAMLGEPKPVEMGNSYFDRFLLVDAGQGKAVEKAKTEMATRLKDRAGTKLMLLEVLTEAPDANRIAAGQIAVYGQAAIVTNGDELKPLIDLLNEEAKGYSRLATVNALAAWIAQSPGNTATLSTALVAKLGNEQDSDTILRLLRGAAARDPDRLVVLLTNPSVAIRELALWNLVNFVDPTAVRSPVLVTDVALLGMPVYEKFVKGWKSRLEELKMKK